VQSVDGETCDDDQSHDGQRNPRAFDDYHPSVLSLSRRCTEISQVTDILLRVTVMHNRPSMPSELGN
jgi:hypothetical protein